MPRPTTKVSSLRASLLALGALALVSVTAPAGALPAQADGSAEAPRPAPSTLPAPQVRRLTAGTSAAPAAAAPKAAPAAGAPAAATDPLYGSGSSIANAGSSGWTTPPAGGSVQPAPVPITSTWSAPAAPAQAVVGATPAQPAAPPCAPPPAPMAAPAERTWSGCALPCADGISMWHVRGVIGEAFSFGEDPIDNCLYWGGDIGRTFCGCWGLDAFYRYHSGQLDRNNPGDPIKDGGSWNHVGVKVTFEGQIGSSKFYWWAGVGPEYFWTQDYLNDDDGFGVFGEAGLGYLLSRNLRLRLGVNVHGMDTDVTRELPADDGESRWLWVVAPVAEVEFSF